MADVCIFCGRTLSFLSDNGLICGGVSQPACSRCTDRYITLPLRQRARLALDTGRAREPENIQKYLDQMDEKLAMEARRSEFQAKTLTCCGQRMTQVDEVSFLSRTSLFQTYTGNMIMFRCDLCGQMKLFDASFLKYTVPELEVPIPPEEPIPAEKPKAPRFKSGKKPPWER